jgi:zinc/manganese transport system permease protein
MSVALEFLWVPFLACLVLTGIHAYLGLHVLARGVIFVDLALAQVAALGITVAFLAGHPIQSTAAYWYALVFTVGGALLFAVSRTRRPRIPQEAVIGIVYAVGAAAAVLVVDRAPQGSEHIKQLLVGSILTVTPAEVGTLAALYAGIGGLHWVIRRPLLEISLDPEAALARGRRVRWWDFVFYASFGVVVTSSVRIAGVLLVFAYLIVPAAAGALLAKSVAGRLLIGWALGVLVSLAGLAASFAWDLPTGATVVTTFGALLAVVALGLGARALLRDLRARGPGALTGVGTAAAALVGLAGLLLLLFPRMDHHWLNWLEEAVPSVQTAFLSPAERATYRDSREAIRRDQAELSRLRRLQQQVQWGMEAMPAEQQERLRQFLASQGEITAGDQMVLRTLRGKARERQRVVLGLPLLAAGAAGAFVLGRRARGRGTRARPAAEKGDASGEG